MDTFLISAQKYMLWVLIRMSNHNICFHAEIGKTVYSNNPKYWDRQAWANSVDPDQMPHSAASDQGLHFLPLV